MINQYLNDPIVLLVAFLLCAAIAVGTLLSAMRKGGSAIGIIIALLFGGIAAWLSVDVFAMMGQEPGMN